MRKSGRIVGFMLLTLVLLSALAIIYIRPAEQLDLHYTEISWKDKLRGMAESRKAELTITEYDLDQLAKKELQKYIAEHELPMEITGASFQLNGKQITAHLAATWGVIDAGVQAIYEMEYLEGRLILSPITLKIRQLALQPETVGLQPILMDLGAYLPDVVEVKEIIFQGDSLLLKFGLDWLEVARYLDLL